MATLLEEDVLRRIFDLLPVSQNSRNAVVCRAWSEVALDHVWEIVDAGAFEALGPMVAKNLGKGNLSWVSCFLLEDAVTVWLTRL